MRSEPAKVTDVHRSLAATAMNETSLAYVAQTIANSEANAIDRTWLLRQKEVEDLKGRLTKDHGLVALLEKDNLNLREEVKTLKAAHWLHELTPDQLAETRNYASVESFKTKLDKAEATMKDWRVVIDTEVARGERFLARAEKAEQALASMYAVVDKVRGLK